MSIEEPSRSKTELIHLTYEGNFQLECTATIIKCQTVESPTITKEDEINEGKDHVVMVYLDRTTMHPQGGGQPSDIGVIADEAQGILLKVDKVGKIGGFSDFEVVHTGRLMRISGNDIVDHDIVSFSPGSAVSVSVDADRRRLLSECHTAGHVVDSAMSRCGQVLPPSKGYHFLDGPYVEYRGVIPPNERVELLQKLKIAFKELVDENIETSIETLDVDKAEKVCNRLAQNFDLSCYGDGDVRVVNVGGWPCPCGGTHVASTADLKQRNWGISGIKCKKGVVRIKYGQNTT